MKLPAKYKGLLFSVLASLCFSGMSAFVRLSGDLPLMQKALFRNLPALAIASYIMFKNKIPLRVEPVNRWSMLGRCAAGTTGLLLNFYAIDHLVLADANMLNKLSPFFSILFSVFLLREKLKPAQAVGVSAAFCGALLIIKPSGGSMDFWPAVGGVLGGMGAGLAYTFVRKMGYHQENKNRIVFYFSLFSCLVTLPFFIGTHHSVTLRQVLLLLCAGLCGAGGQFSITRAYFYAPARELSVYEYLQVLFAAVWGFFLFNQIPDVLSFLGYAIIIGSAVIMFFYNNHTGPFRTRNTAAHSK